VAPRRADTSTILVVEDDPVARELYRVALMAGGYAVIAVRDGVDALRVMEQHQPAAVVLDLGLPGVSGADVAQEMFAQPTLKAVPIIIVTGDATGIDPTRFACVLHKPIDPIELIDAVTKCLSLHRGRE
jgi:two-component system cell cycle response regulator DivK